MSHEMKRKLSSRKLWVAIAGFVCALGALFGVSESVSAQISSVITAGGVAVAYILGESIVDASTKE